MGLFLFKADFYFFFISSETSFQLYLYSLLIVSLCDLTVNIVKLLILNYTPQQNPTFFSVSYFLFAFLADFSKDQYLNPFYSHLLHCNLEFFLWTLNHIMTFNSNHYVTFKQLYTHVLKFPLFLVYMTPCSLCFLDPMTVQS